MANLLRDLLKSVNRRDPIQGKVVNITGSLVQVTTAAGVKEVVNGSASLIREGDTVKLNGSSIVGILASPDSLPVYHL